jgi:uncharacterized protein (TIGR02266 family)
MENQRRFPRAPLSGVVKFYNWDKPMQASAKEISPGGIFLQTAQALPEGSLLTLRLSIPGLSGAFTILGKVVRTVRGGLLRPAGMGVRFIDIPAKARAQIFAYVTMRSLRAAA